MDYYNKLPDTGYMRIKAILHFFPVSESHFWEQVKLKNYPQPIKLSPKITVWRAEDIHELINKFNQNGEV